MNNQYPNDPNEPDSAAHLPLRRGPARRVFFGMIEAAAMVLSVVWVLVATSLNDSEQTNGVLFAVLLVLPVVVIWVAALTLRSLRDLRAESRELKAAVATIRKSMIVQQHSRVGHSPSRPVENRPAPTPSAPLPAEHPQPAPETDELTLPDFVRALNFPDGPDDQDGIRALRMALADPAVAKLIRSAQDVLNLMAENNIFMDDLPPGSVSPDLWRRFATGERGGDITLLAAQFDQEALDISASRLQSDAIFHDAVHHFLRQFDKTVVTFEQAATDDELAQLAQTRTARAFMLLGSVTQIFG